MLGETILDRSSTCDRLSKLVFEPLRRDEDSILYRRRTEEDSSQVLVLAPAKEEAGRESVRRLEHEYFLRGELDPAWAARPIALAKVQLQQVILNLVMNAIEAMNGVAEEARQLHVSSQKITETRLEPGKETIEAIDVNERGKSFVLIAVRDSGPGLDPTQIKHVFETFYTTKSGGMGMGLAISRSIIEAHHGRLWVSSNTPRGAFFQFTLPGRD